MILTTNEEDPNQGQGTKLKDDLSNYKPERDKLGRWKKGSSGNPAGYAPNPITHALRKACKDPGLLKALVDVAIERAKGGDHRFFNSICDRVEGKPVQQLNVADNTRAVSMIDQLLEALLSLDVPIETIEKAYERINTNPGAKDSGTQVTQES